jgi:hypothetical protein
MLESQVKTKRQRPRSRSYAVVEALTISVTTQASFRIPIGEVTVDVKVSSDNREVYVREWCFAEQAFWQ